MLRSLAALTTLTLLLAGCGDAEQQVDESYAALKAQLGPQEQDRAWQQIPWLPSYRQGLEAASSQQKPILLWVMNGHPLGCT